MPFVLDASVSAAWFLKDEDDDPIGKVAWDRVRADTAFAPSIWWYEIRNALLMAERKKRLDAADIELAWSRLQLLRVEIDSVFDTGRTLELARRHRLTIYDAAYLELAARLKVPLATGDEALDRAAKAERIERLGRV